MAFDEPAPQGNSMDPTYLRRLYEWQQRKKAAEDAERAAKEAALTSTGEGGQLARDRAGDLYDQSRNREAPLADRVTVGNVAQGNAAQIDQSQQGQFRGQQLGLAQALGQKAAGQGPFMSDIAMRQAQDQNLQAQQALLAGARGSQAAGAARMAAQQASGFGQQIAAQGAQARMQEQLGAQGQLAGLLQGARGQDIGLATSQAELGQQMNLANLSAENQKIFQQAGIDAQMSLADQMSKLQTAGMNDQLALASLAQAYGVDLAEMQARLQLELGKMGQPKGPSGWDYAMQLGGTAIGLGALLSDVGMKKDIVPVSKKDRLLDSFLRGQANAPRAEGRLGSLQGLNQALMGAAADVRQDRRDQAVIDRQAAERAAAAKAEHARLAQTLPLGVSSNGTLVNPMLPADSALSDVGLKKNVEKAVVRGAEKAGGSLARAMGVGGMPARLMRGLPPAVRPATAGVGAGRQVNNIFGPIRGEAARPPVEGSPMATAPAGYLAGYDLAPRRSEEDRLLAMYPSDERSKEVIDSQAAKIDELMDQVRAYEYEYRDEAGMPPGRHLGVMAQDLQDSELGSDMVVPDAEGNLMVDYGSNLSTMQAEIARLNERLRDVEGKKLPRKKLPSGKK